MEATRSHLKSPATSQVLNLTELRRFIGELRGQEQGERADELLFDLLAKLLDKNNQQAIRIGALLRERFGRKSEKLDPRQLALFLASLDEQA